MEPTADFYKKCSGEIIKNKNKNIQNEIIETDNKTKFNNLIYILNDNNKITENRIGSLSPLFQM